MNSGNGKTGTLRERIAHNQAQRDRAIAELEGSEWEDETTETQIIVQGGTVVVDQTGKHKALQVDPEADRPTPTDPPPPAKAPAPLTIVWVAVSRMPPWGVVLVALAVVVAYVLLRR